MITRYAFRREARRGLRPLRNLPFSQRAAAAAPQQHAAEGMHVEGFALHTSHICAEGMYVEGEALHTSHICKVLVLEQRPEWAQNQLARLDIPGPRQPALQRQLECVG